MNRLLEKVSQRLGRPSFTDWVFVCVWILILVSGRCQLLNDPGIPWHVQLGREILRTHSVPTHDAFTFTRSGENWVDQSWLFDAGLAFTVDRFGWSAAVLACSAFIAWIYSSLASDLLAQGRKSISALVATILALAVGSVHCLVRPHLLTLAFVLIASRICRRQHERGGWSVFAIPVLVGILANLHGGFLAGPLILVTAGIGHALSGRREVERRSHRRSVLSEFHGQTHCDPWGSDHRANLAKFGAAAFLSLLTPIVNPYGIGLYRHVFGLLASDLPSLIQEYQPIPFGKPEAIAVEAIILLLFSLPILCRNATMSRYEWVQTLVWLHLSLATIRHAPLFGIVVAPGLARMLDAFVSEDASAADQRSEKRTIWPATGVLALFLGIVGGWSFGGWDPAVWPLGALPSLEKLSASEPLFHEQDWGGLIECVTDAKRPAYIDDRFELFGRPMLLEYVGAIEGGPEWETIRDREGIRLVWVRPNRGLARKLEKDREWTVIHRDPVSVLLERKPSADQAIKLTEKSAAISASTREGVEDQHLELLVLPSGP